MQFQGGIRSVFCRTAGRRIKQTKKIKKISIYLNLQNDNRKMAETEKKNLCQANADENKKKSMQNNSKGKENESYFMRVDTRSEMVLLSGFIF